MKIFILIISLLLMTSINAFSFSYKYYIPYFDMTNGNTIGISLVNESSSPGTISIKYYWNGGHLLLRESKQISSNGHISFNPSINLNTRGNIQIESSIKLTGIVLSGNINSPIYDIDLKESLYNKFRVAQVDTIQWKSILMISNPNNSNITIFAKIYNNNGNLIFTINIFLPSFGSNQVNLGNYVNISSGSIILESSDKFVGFMLYDGTNFNNKWKAGLSTIPIN